MSNPEFTFEKAKFDTDVAAAGISDELRRFIEIYTASQNSEGKSTDELSDELVYKYLDKLESSDSYTVYSDEGGMIGAALVDVTKNRMWVEGIAVDAEWREAGVGKFAMRELARIALYAGCSKLSGLAQPSESTLMFYKKLGMYQDDAIGTPEEYGGLVPMSADLPNEHLP